MKGDNMTRISQKKVLPARLYVYFKESTETEKEVFLVSHDPINIIPRNKTVLVGVYYLAEIRKASIKADMWEEIPQELKMALEQAGL